MKTERKSFILHFDSIQILDDLSDEQAGKLFKAMRDFVVDGIEPELDQVLKIAFRPFRNQFKRDEEKYEKACLVNMVNRLMGTLKASEPDVYRLLSAMSVDERIEWYNSRSSTIIDGRHESSRIVTDNESKSVSKSVSKKKPDSGSGNKKNAVNNELTTANIEVSFSKGYSFLQEDVEWQEAIADTFLLTIHQIKVLVDRFPSHAKSQGKDRKRTLRDLKSYFANWVGVLKENGSLPPKEPKKQVRNRYIEDLDI